MWPPPSMTTRSPGSASAGGDLRAAGALAGRRVRKRDAELRVHELREARAVEAGRVRAAVAYGTPWYCMATATTWSRLKLGYGGLARKSLDRRAGVGRVRHDAAAATRAASAAAAAALAAPPHGSLAGDHVVAVRGDGAAMTSSATATDCACSSQPASAAASPPCWSRLPASRRRREARPCRTVPARRAP